MSRELNGAQIARVQERLHRSRAELFDLAHEIRGDRPEPESIGSDRFPRSRIMRALGGKPGRMALAAAALALVASRRGMALRVGRLAPLLRPVLMRFLVRRLVG